MKLLNAIELLRRIYDHAGSRRDSMTLSVVIHQPGALGGTPGVDVNHIQAGIDWDAGRVLLTVDTPLTKLSPENVAAINQSVKAGQSWHAYQAHKKMIAHIADLEHQLAAMRSQVEQIVQPNQ